MELLFATAIGAITATGVYLALRSRTFELVLGLTLCSLVWWRYRDEDLSGVARPSSKTIVKALVIAFPALLLPFVIRAAVVEGVATATEVSTIGIVYAVLAGVLIYRQFPLKRLYPMLVATAGLSGAILLIIGAATGMAWALTQSGFSATLAAALKGLPGGAPVFLIVSARSLGLPDVRTTR